MYAKCMQSDYGDLKGRYNAGFGRMYAGSSPVIRIIIIYISYLTNRDNTCIVRRYELAMRGSVW